MPAHIHAQLMEQYAQDALKTDKPWELWELSENGNNWFLCSGHPSWNVTVMYRRKRVPLCQIEGRDVYKGDKLWHTIAKQWIIACSTGIDPRSIKCDNYNYNYGEVHIPTLSWSEPAKTKTIYKWAFKYMDSWLLTTRYFETAEEAAQYEKGGSDFHCLEWTALEVPV